MRQASVSYQVTHPLGLTIRIVVVPTLACNAETEAKQESNQVNLLYSLRLPPSQPHHVSFYSSAYTQMFAYLLHTVGNCVPLTLVVAAVNWLDGETKKRTRLEKVGEERVYRGLKPLCDVLDLKDPIEVKNLAAMVPFIKGANDGDILPHPISFYRCPQPLLLLLGWDLTLYKAKLHAKDGWSTYDKSERHKTVLLKEKEDNAALLLQVEQRHEQTLTSQKEKYEQTVNNLKSKLHESQVTKSNLKRAKENWKARAGAEANLRRSLCHGRNRVEAAMERIGEQLRGCRTSRDTYKQRSENLQRKKSTLLASGRWDLRTPLLNLLSKEERKQASIRHVLSRIKDKGGLYSNLSVNYGPKIIQDWGVTANTLRPVMADAFAWMVTEDEVPAFQIQHRTTVSRQAVSRAKILKTDAETLLESDEVKFISAMADASNRAKKAHTPVGATWSSKFEVHKMAIKDSVIAGKTGKSEAQHVYESFSPLARKKLGSMVYDTTSSNTGKVHGLGAELNRLTEMDLMNTECLLHVESLPMVDFGTRLCGECPSLHWGVNTPPNAIALMLFLKYVENREWPDLREAYFTLWGERYTARSECVFSRWKYVFWASIQARHRNAVVKAMALLKTTWLTDADATGCEVPPPQPIAIVGCTTNCTSTACTGHSITARACDLPTEATKVKRQRHVDPKVQPLSYFIPNTTTVNSDQMTECEAACLDEAAELPIDWSAEATTDQCEEFFMSMFEADEGELLGCSEAADKPKPSDANSKRTTINAIAQAAADAVALLSSAPRVDGATIAIQAAAKATVEALVPNAEIIAVPSTDAAVVVEATTAAAVSAAAVPMAGTNAAANVAAGSSGVDGLSVDSGPSAGVCFNLKDAVRVWCKGGDGFHAGWYTGRIDRLMPASVEVYYTESDTYSIHRLRATLLEHLPRGNGIEGAAAGIGGAAAGIEGAAAGIEGAAAGIDGTAAGVEGAAAGFGGTAAATEDATTEDDNAPDEVANTTDGVPDSTAEMVRAAVDIEGAVGEGLPEKPGKRPKGPRVKLVPPASLDECGYHNRRFRPKVAGTLWQMLLYWMSGSCGLYLYIQISVMALSSSVFFHSMNWAMGSDDRPRLLQADGGFIALPDGRRALELPDYTLAYLRELNIARYSWGDTFKDEIELAKQLPDDLEKDILEAIPAAYDAAIKKYKAHLTTYQLLPNSLSRISEPTGPAYLRAFIVVFFPGLAAEEGFDTIEVDDDDVVQSDAEEVTEILSQPSCS